MSLRVFTQEDRAQIVQSPTNNSKSKQFWTFSKQKRFILNKANCPYISYSNKSTLNPKTTEFGKDRRRVFTEHSQVPSSWNYYPQKSKNIDQCVIKVGIGFGRNEVVANSYIDQQVIKNPGPGRYNINKISNSVAYSVRPKTANHRTYFIDDKEKSMVPGPGSYTNFSIQMGVNKISKFRSTTYGLMGKDSRFKSYDNGVPAPFAYQNIKHRWKSGAKIGYENRSAFTDQAAERSFTPGPGNYKLPSEFGHYKHYKSFNKGLK